MPVIRSLLTHFGFKVEKGKLQSFNQQVTATKGRLRVAARESRNMQRQMRGIGNMARYAVAAFIGSRFVRTFTTGFTKPLDELAKFSRQVGISVETLQGLAHAGSIAGVGVKEMQASLLRFSRSLRDAQEGSKKIEKAFRDVGISVRDLPLEDQEQTLMAIADRFAELPAGANKAALAQELFGRSGAKLIPLLNEGSKGIQALMKEAKELGIVLSKEDAKAAEEFNDQMARVKAAFQGLRNAIARQIIPVLTRLLRRFQQWYREGRNAERLLTTLKRVAAVAGAILAGIVTAKVINLFKAFGNAVTSATRMLMALGKAGIFAKIKLFAMVALFILLALAIEDLYAFATGKRSLIGDALGEDSEQAKILREALLEFGKALQELWEELKEPLLELGKSLIVLFKDIQPILRWVLRILVWILIWSTRSSTAIINMYKDMAAAIKEAWAGMVMFFEDVTNDIETFFTDLWNGIKSTFETVWNFITGTWKDGTGGIIKAWNTVGDAIKAIINSVEKAFKSVFDWVLRQIGWLSDKITGLAERLGIISKGKIGAGLGTITAVGERELRRMQMQQQNRVSIGSVAVNVAGTADMGSAEFQGAVRSGVGQALDDFVQTAFADLRPVTT